MGSQSTAKTLFLLASMAGWLIVGAALMDLFPLLADRLVASDLTQTSYVWKPRRFSTGRKNELRLEPPTSIHM
jgi:hypothetical protein